MISHIKSYQDKLTKEDIKLLYECLAILYTNQSNYAEALSVYLKYGDAPIGHFNEYPTMQFLTGISRNTQSKLYMLSLTECVRDFQNSALWEAH